jgi:hypothetical protein
MSAPYTNGSPPPTSAADTAKEASKRRLFRKLLGDLAAVTGLAVSELAATAPKAARRRGNRVLFRRADTLTDIDLDRLVAEVGAGRLMAALDRWSQPSLRLEAAE